LSLRKEKKGWRIGKGINHEGKKYAKKNILGKREQRTENGDTRNTKEKMEW